MKVVYGSIYTHKTNIRELNPSDVWEVFKARNMLPKTYLWNLLRIDRDKSRISFMWYPKFYEYPHPSLEGSISVNITTGALKCTSATKNPVILHRKETFISKDDPYYEKFRLLTIQEENAGLYTKGILSKIGRQDYWNSLLKEKELVIVDHVLQDISVLADSIMPASAKTAIGRQNSSAPAKMVVDMVTASDKVFDWGCGRGGDIEYYNANGIDAEGWDPHFKPAPHPSECACDSFNFVTCTFVLNVIKNAHERSHCIESIYDFLPDKGIALFTVRTSRDIEEQARANCWQPQKNGGWITGKGTFQIGFTPAELETLVTEFDGAETIRKAPLVVIATK